MGCYKSINYRMGTASWIGHLHSRNAVQVGTLYTLLDLSLEFIGSKELQHLIKEDEVSFLNMISATTVRSPLSWS